MNKGDLAFCAGPSMTMKLLPAEFTGALLTLAGRKVVTHNSVLVQALVQHVRVLHGGCSFLGVIFLSSS
jgi:hypothetical protein